MTEGETPKSLVSLLPYRLGVLFVCVISATSCATCRLFEALAASDKAVSVTFDLLPRSYRFRAEHPIRVAVAS